jgi:hypothetical protein
VRRQLLAELRSHGQLPTRIRDLDDDNIDRLCLAAASGRALDVLERFSEEQPFAVIDGIFVALQPVGQTGRRWKITDPYWRALDTMRALVDRHARK